MNGVMSSWVDADIREVVAQWGEPDEVRPIGDLDIYVWNHLTAVTSPEITVRALGITAHTGSTTAEDGTPHENCQRLLAVNPHGRVVDWQWHGDGCPHREEGVYADWRKKANGP